MRRQRWIVPLAAATLLAGCGDRRLLLTVDVLSFLDPASTNAAFGPVAPVPGGFVTGEQPLVADESVHTLEGLSGTVDVTNVEIALAAIVRDSTGSGDDTLRVYASDAATPPRQTPPLLVLPFTMSPGVTDTLRATITGDARVRQLFRERSMRVSVTTSLRGPASGDPLNGAIRLQQFEATVVAGRSL